MDTYKNGKDLKIHELMFANFNISKKSFQKKEVARYVITDDGLEYECISFFRKIINIVLIPLLNLLSYPIGIKLVSLGKRAYSVKKNATTHKALEAIYTYKFNSRDLKNNIKETIANYFWFNLINCKAVRNRLKLVKKILEKIIIALGKEEIKIISLASGSARAVIETIAKYKNNGVKIRSLLVDQNKEALEYSKWLAEYYKINNIEIIQDKIENISNDISKFNPDIIEMVGLLDYFENDRVIKLINDIYNSLPDHGVFITCNINYNSEKRFVTNVIKWPLIYRNESELFEVVTKGGFDPSYVKIIYEPMKIHGIVVAFKGPAKIIFNSLNK